MLESTSPRAGLRDTGDLGDPGDRAGRADHRAATDRWPRVTLSHVWLVAAIAIPLVVVASARMGTVDLTYHLRAGAEMLDARALVQRDSFTFSAAGRSWVDQQWLAQVLMAAVFRAGGWLGLALARLLTSAIVLIALAGACRARGASVRASAALTLAGGAILLPTLQLRPQLLGEAAFAIALWLLASRERAPWRLWFIVPLVALWANLHGTFFLAIGLIGLAWLEDVHARRPGAWRLVAVGLATIVATMANPYGARVWLYVLQLSSNGAVRGMVAEWQPTSIASYSGTAFLVSVPVALLVVARGRVALAWPFVLTLASFFLIGVLSVRGTCWWALAAPVALAGAGIGWGDDVRQPVARDTTPARALHLALVVALVLAVLVPVRRWLPLRDATPWPYHELTDAPYGITLALSRELAPGERLFNAQRWGSWFEFALPENPVAVDSRIEVIPGDTWAQYADVSNGREGWQRVLDEWGVRVLALSATQQSSLIVRVNRDPRWIRLHRDADGSVYVRNPTPAR